MPGRNPYLELHVSSLGATSDFERQEQYLDRLAALERTGAIDGYSVTVWGDGLVLGSKGASTSLGRRFGHRLFVLSLWCAVNGADPEALFATSDSVDGYGEFTTVEFEPLVLVEYDRTRVQFASPYDDDRSEVSVGAHLDTLAPPTDGRLVVRTDAVPVEDPSRSGRLHAPSVDRQGPDRHLDALEQ